MRSARTGRSSRWVVDPCASRPPSIPSGTSPCRCTRSGYLLDPAYARYGSPLTYQRPFSHARSSAMSRASSSRYQPRLVVHLARHDRHRAAGHGASTTAPYVPSPIRRADLYRCGRGPECPRDGSESPSGDDLARPRRDPGPGFCSDDLKIIRLARRGATRRSAYLPLHREPRMSTCLRGPALTPSVRTTCSIPSLAACPFRPARGVSPRAGDLHRDLHRLAVVARVIRPIRLVVLIRELIG